jgi:hypothetical protein
MWWLWPHLRRLWAAAGTVSAGFAVNYLYGLLGNQPAPTLSRLIDYLWPYRYWSLSALVAFAVVSVFAERQFRKHEARAPHRCRCNVIRFTGGLLSRFKLKAQGRVRFAGTVRYPQYGWTSDRIGPAYRLVRTGPERRASRAGRGTSSKGYGYLLTGPGC